MEARAQGAGATPKREPAWAGDWNVMEGDVAATLCSVSHWERVLAGWSPSAAFVVAVLAQMTASPSKTDKDLSYIAFIMLRYVPSIPAFRRVLIIKGCWLLSKAFSASIEIIIWFLSFNLLNWILDFPSALHEHSIHHTHHVQLVRPKTL